MKPTPPSLSVVVVAYEQARELPRTLRTMAPPYQRDLPEGSYELVVVDNGSTRPLAEVVPSDLGVRVSTHRIDPAPASPARAANLGLDHAAGDLVGLVIDGARMASPGLLSTALIAARLHPRAVITAPAWQLGRPQDPGGAGSGLDQASEDRLLAATPWELDGYELFSISSPAGSSGRGLFGPMGESSSLFMARDLWAELGGLDERFELPGGGLVNHDLYRRACALAGAQLVVLLGEGTFHQTHGGAATSHRVPRAAMWAEYEQLRGEAHRPPVNRPVFVGQVPPQYLPHLSWSAQRALGCGGTR